jgi:hypothetical protein
MGELATIASMRTNGKMNSASHDVNWALVTVIIVVIQPMKFLCGTKKCSEYFVRAFMGMATQLARECC